MKKLSTVLILGFSFLMAAVPSGDELLDTVINSMNPENAKAIMTQTIVTTSGSERTLKYETDTNEKGKNSIIRYLSPSRVRGNAMMMKNFSDDIWMFNARTKRIRKLASHAKKQKFEGSDFTYEDMGSGDSWKEDYTPKNIGIKKYDGIDCTLLEMTQKSSDISYSKMIIYLRPSDYYPLKIEYYNKNEKLQKILFLQDIKIIQNIPTAMKMVMENQMDKTKTTMSYEKIDYNVSFDKNFFSERNLKR